MRGADVDDALELGVQRAHLGCRGKSVEGGNEIGVSGVRPLVKRMLQQEDVPVIIQADNISKSGLLVNVVDRPAMSDFLMGSIIDRFESKGLNIIALKMLRVSPERVSYWYSTWPQ